MNKIITNNFSIEIINKNNLEGIKAVQKFRYTYLCKEYNPQLPEEGFDDDGHDLSSDILVVKDINKDIIVGTYRVTTTQTNTNNDKYLIERQYDISHLINNNINFGCVSRLCIHKDYRDGYVIKLLLKGLFTYLFECDTKCILGLCSFHGTNPTIYPNAFSYLANGYLLEKSQFKAVMNAVPITSSCNIDNAKLKNELPGILRIYLKLGAKLHNEASIDKEFNSTDVLIIFEKDNLNTKYIDLITR